MIDEVDTINQDNKSLVWCTDFCVDGHDVWMIHGEFNAVINYNMQTNRTKLLTIIPDTKIFGEFLFIRIIKYKHNLIFVPYFADYLVVYDLFDNKYVLKKYLRDIYKTQAIFSDACVIQNRLYCMPHTVGNPITVLDLDKLCDTEIIAFRESNCNEKNINHCFAKEGVIYSVMLEIGYLLKYNTFTDEVSTIEICGIKGISGIAGMDDKLYLKAFPENKLIVWNTITQKVESEILLERSSGAICEMSENTVWVDTNELYSNIINVKDGHIDKFEKSDRENQLMKPTFVSGPAYRLNGVFYYYNRIRSCFMRYNGEKWDVYDIRLDLVENKEYKKSIRIEDEIIKESNCLRLADFIKMI